MSASETKKSRLETRPSIDGGTRRCRSVPHTTWAPSNSTPTMKSATTMTHSHDVSPMIASGTQPTPHARIMSVRYRRGIRSDATVSEPTAPPSPNAPSASANAPAPPPVWSFTANGSSTSIGPMMRKTRMIENTSVANSHRVRSR